MRQLVSIIVLMLICPVNAWFQGIDTPAEHYLASTEISALQLDPNDHIISASNNAGLLTDEALFECIFALQLGSDNTIGFDYSCEGVGPESFVVRNDGTIVILDSVNRRIVYYCIDGTVGQIEIPTTDYPIAMAENSKAIFVLDNGGLITRYDKKTNIFSCFKSPIPIAFTSYLTHMSDSVYIVDDNGGYHTVEGDPPKHVNGISPEEYSIPIGECIRGTSYRLHYEPIDKPIVLGEVLLICTNVQHRSEEYAILRFEDYDHIPKQPLYYSDEGMVFLMACIDGKIAVFNIITGKTYNSHIAELEQLAELMLSGCNSSDCLVHGERVFMLNTGSSTNNSRPTLNKMTMLSLSDNSGYRFVPAYSIAPAEKLFFRVILQAPG